jgi:hypothetical protein
MRKERLLWVLIILGLDVANEGLFSSKSKGSYLANYRYPSLVLLDQIGIVDFGGFPKYQEGFFKFFLPTKKMLEYLLYRVTHLNHRP